jgi:hypothetical protein
MCDNLHILRQPIIRTVQPDMVGCIINRDGLLTTTQDITLMALAYQAVKLGDENSILL